MTESEYTKSIFPTHQIEEELTMYNWREDEKNQNKLALTKQVK